ncbi:MAG: hypothetical protein IPH43_05590 [Xanthomonadales bacterium]|nr:hypothetical protein [Xanthomonadales bacterium]
MNTIASAAGLVGVTLAKNNTTTTYGPKAPGKSVMRLRSTEFPKDL